MMFNKNILCLLLFITVIVSMGCVSATDDNVTADSNLPDIDNSSNIYNDNFTADSDNLSAFNQEKNNTIFRVEYNESDITINVNNGQLIIHPKNFENGLIYEVYGNGTCSFKKINDSYVLIHDYAHNCSLIFNKSSDSISINGSCVLDFNKMFCPLHVLHEFNWLFNPYKILLHKFNWLFNPYNALFIRCLVYAI